MGSHSQGALPGAAMLSGPARNPRRTLAMLTGCFAFCGLAYGGQGVLFAEMVRVLGMSTGGYGSAETTPPLVGFVFLVCGGPLTLLIGKKAVAVLGFALFA